MQVIHDDTVERQLKDITPEFLLRCNPHARAAGIKDLGESPTYCEYIDRLEVALEGGKEDDNFAEQLNANAYGRHQLTDMAELLGLMDEWSRRRGDSRSPWYAAQRLDGSSHKWADMAVHASPP